MISRSGRAAVVRMNVELAGILRSLRQESRTPRMVAMGLDAVMASLGAEGGAVIRCPPGAFTEEPEVLHRVGAVGLTMKMAGMLLGQAEIGTPALAQEANGRPIATAVCRQRGSEK